MNVDMPSNTIGYCGNHCTYCFFKNCKGCKGDNACDSYANLFEGKQCPNAVCCKAKGYDGCWECDILEEYNIGFFNSDENDAKAYSLFIKKYSTEKYTDTIISLMSKGYDYPKQFKGINDVNEILEIFEKEK